MRDNYQEKQSIISKVILLIFLLLMEKYKNVIKNKKFKISAPT